MNEIYRRHRYKRVQYLNGVFCILLVIFEVYLQKMTQSSLLFVPWLSYAAAFILLGIFIASWIEDFRDHYIVVLSLTMTCLMVSLFIYVDFIEENETARYLNVVFLIIYLSLVERDRVYRQLTAFIVFALLIGVVFSQGDIDERLIRFTLSLVIVVGYYIRCRYMSRLNHDFYQVYGVQKKLVDKMSQGYALNEAIWNEDHTKVMDYRFISVNTSFESITGLVRSEIEGHSVLDLLPKIEQDWIEAYSQVMVSQRESSFVNYVRAFDKYLKVRAYPVDGKTFVTLFTDITEIMRNEQQLKEKIRDARKANDFKSQFLKDVNHRLRTPLNGMMGMAQLIALEDLPEGVDELFHTMMVEMNHAHNIINQIAEYTELKKDTYEITENNLKKDIEIICDQYRRDLDRVIDVDYQISETGHVLYYEQSVFQRVLETLIRNGIKHSQSKRIAITITMSKDSEAFKMYMEVRVSDFGKGIEKDQMEMIFNQLHHQDFIHIYRQEGHMSLPLCKALMSHIGGDLLCSSTESEGAIFTMKMPIFDQVKK